MASKMLLFPLPLRPVMALKRGSNPVISVRWAYDLKPSSTICFMYMTSVKLQRWSTPIRISAGFFTHAQK